MASRAVFLDRDGVLNKKRQDYVKSVEELEYLRGVGTSLLPLQRMGFKLVIVTNQSAVNRGIISRKTLDEINSVLLAELRKEECMIDAVYVCPHRPDESCDCRKPKAGLLIRASNDLGIDLRGSWIVGDSDSDIETGMNVGCRGVKIFTDSGLDEAVDFILRQEDL